MEETMKIIFSCFWTVFVMFSLLGCAIDVGQPASPTASPLPAAPALNASNATQSSNQIIPITWSDLHLSGRIVYSTVSANGSISTPRIQVLDLATGEIKTIFTATDNAWIHYLTVSPDGTQLVMSYSPPSQAGSLPSTSLYILPLQEAAVPQLLFEPLVPADQYLQVEWSPDGRYLFFVHFNQENQPSDQPFPEYQISSMAFPGGQPEIILDHAFWPRISADSSKIVYVASEPVSGTNRLFLANMDGSSPQEIVLSDFSEIIDAPIFSPDGVTILFSAPSPIQAYEPNWLDRLFGVQIAKAHNVPSDWWSVPISGGTVTRLTQIQTIKLFASVSPDEKHIASQSGEGIFVMNVDGSNVRQLLFDPGVSSVVNWIP
jgi:Tol biopolymer transport system component